MRLSPAVLVLIPLLLGAAGPAPVAAPDRQPPTGQTVAASSTERGVLFSPETAFSDGAVTVGGTRIDYRAAAGTLVVHPKGWDDAAARVHEAAEAGDKKGAELGADANPQAEASMFYVAYFKKGAPSRDRPITFFYNGGPGSSTVWLHMGAFGPRRVVTRDDTHTPAPPYGLVENAESLLDVTDLVFIDAPGRLQPDRRQGQGEGLLRRGPGRLRLRRVHLGLPH